MIERSRLLYIGADLLDRDGVAGDLIEGQWRRGAQMNQMDPEIANNSSVDAQSVRDHFLNFFSNEGAVTFQYSVLDLDRDVGMADERVSEDELMEE